MMRMFVFVALMYNLQTGQLARLETVGKCQRFGAILARVFFISHPFPNHLYLDDAIVEEVVSNETYNEDCTGGYTYDVIGNTKERNSSLVLPRYFNSCSVGEVK